MAAPGAEAHTVVSILVVDDEAGLREALRASFEEQGWRIDTAASGTQALERLTVRLYDLVVLDERMPGMHGLEVLRRIRERPGWTQVLVLTAYGDDRLFGELADLRCDGYMGKPFEVDELLGRVRRLLERRAVTAEQLGLPAPQPAPGLVGRSRAMEAVYNRIRRFAAHDLSILVTGETGVGKERVARAVHALSRRAQGPFVDVNCANLESLVESELFGHVAGAFTDAKRTRPGLFVEASGGTVFLDEVSELPSHAQAKLLRAIQERVVRPVGGNRPIHIDVRFIAASNADLRDEVRARRFREDLYYRLADGVIEVPPLRQRIEDVPALAGHFLAVQASERGEEPRRLAPAALRKLLDYHWPGNVRQLESVLRRAVAIAGEPTLGPSDIELPPDVGTAAVRTLAEVLWEAGRSHTLSALQSTGWVKGQAARRLGIARTTLARKLREYRLDEDDK